MIISSSENVAIILGNLALNSQVYQGRLNSGILHGEIKRGNSNLVGETESDARGASQRTPSVLT